MVPPWPAAPGAAPELKGRLQSDQDPLQQVGSLGLAHGDQVKTSSLTTPEGFLSAREHSPKLLVVSVHHTYWSVSQSASHLVFYKDIDQRPSACNLCMGRVPSSGRQSGLIEAFRLLAKAFLP